MPFIKPQIKVKQAASSPIKDKVLFRQQGNVTVLLPGSCAARCEFCFWNREDGKIKQSVDYARRLVDQLAALPRHMFPALSISGGEETKAVDPRIGKIRLLLPELLLYSWTSDETIRRCLQRAQHQFDSKMDSDEFQRLALSALKVSEFALRHQPGITTRQFLAQYYKTVSNSMWDGAPNARALREINSVLGIRQKRTVGVRLRLRDLSKRSDWFTVK